MSISNNRYLLFSGDMFYPNGGAKDLAGTFDTQEDAIDALRSSKASWSHIYDLQRMEILEYNDESTKIFQQNRP